MVHARRESEGRFEFPIPLLHGLVWVSVAQGPYTRGAAGRWLPAARITSYQHSQPPHIFGQHSAIR